MRNGKVTSPPLGDSRRFHVRDVLDQSQWGAVQASLIFRSSTVYLWMQEREEQALRSRGALRPIVDSLATFLTGRLPEGAVAEERGIVGLDERYFGYPPDVDRDGTLDVLLLDIEDGFQQTGAYVAGFFDPNDLTTQPNSNRRDLLYVDTRPTLFYEGKTHVEQAAATIAHEYQHLIHAGHEGEKPELTFLNEGLSELAEILCGFPPRPSGAYFQDPGRSLLSWSFEAPLPDYARASLFMHYLFEQVGYEHVRSFAQSPKTGLDGLRAVLRRAGGPSFEQLFANWGYALMLGDRAENPAYGYRHPARQGVRFAGGYVVDELPQTRSVQLAPLSHTPVDFPLTRRLMLQASGEQVTFAARTSYPDGAGRFLPGTRSGFQIEANAKAYGSIHTLLSNASTEIAKTDTSQTAGNPQVRLLASGERSARRRTLAYDDGLPDAFAGNASYLLLDEPGEAVALAFGPEDAAWLYYASVGVIFASELSGSGVPPSTPRTVTLRVRRVEDSRLGAPLTPPLKRTLRRPFGRLRMEDLSLLSGHEGLSVLRDSFAITLRSGSDENPVAVALDRTAQENGGAAFHRSNGEAAWQSLSSVRVGETSLRGFRPMIRAHIAERSRGVAPSGLQADFAYDVRRARVQRAYVRIRAPFALDTAKTRLVAALPSGQFATGQRVPAAQGRAHFSSDPGSSASLVFALPLRSGAPYAMYAYASSEGREAIRQSFSWKGPDGDGATLGAPYPNPTRGPSMLPLRLLEAAEVRVTVYDLLGRTVRQQAEHLKAAGLHDLVMDLRGLAPGVYFARVRSERARDGRQSLETQKIILVR